jgi:hypothetical protein
VPLRLGVFVLVLAAVFGVGFGLGAALGPEPADTPPAVHEGDHGDQADTGEEHEGMIHDD